MCRHGCNALRLVRPGNPLWRRVRGERLHAVDSGVAKLWRRPWLASFERRPARPVCADFFYRHLSVKGKSGAFAGGIHADMKAGHRALIDRIRHQLRTDDPWIAHALDKIAGGSDLYLWKMTDCRCATWSKGRVALLGDAAAGFLPTAGIGAAMAIESATVLAKRLAAADRKTVVDALQGYERAQRPRVETAQDNSRQLAKLMFRRSRVLAAARDVAARFISLKVALRPIQRLLDDIPMEHS